MIIVLEGPDAAGKTTLAQELEQRGFRRAYHDDPPKPGEDKFEVYTQAILNVKPDEDVIFDRFHLSERVYGVAVRHETQMSIEKLRLINRLLYSRGCLTVLCLPPFEAVTTNWAARRADELVQSSDRLFVIYSAYKLLFEEEYRYLNATVYDYTQQSIYSLCGHGPTKLTIPFLPISMKEGLIGHPEARFLFVGEQSDEDRDLAFYNHERSAHFLNEALWDAGYEEHEMAFTNARKSSAHGGQLRDLSKLYDGRIVITLGKLAESTCRSQGVPHLAAPHPQFIKRFKSKRRKQYVELLKMFRGDER